MNINLMNDTTGSLHVGLIWSRYSLVIVPKNWFLFSVNVFVGATGCYQVSRIIRQIAHKFSKNTCTEIDLIFTILRHKMANKEELKAT